VGVCGNSEYIPTFHELVLVAKPTWTFGGKAVSCLNFSFDSCQKLGAKKGEGKCGFRVFRDEGPPVILTCFTAAQLMPEWIWGLSDAVGSIFTY